MLADLPAEPKLDAAALAATVQRRMPLYDKAQEGHYNLISALHKSLRGSDTDAALYWLARMIAGGEDPRYIARRLVRFAVEDVGPGRSAGAGPGAGRLGSLRAAGLAGGRAGAGAVRDLSGYRAQVQRGLQGAGAAMRLARETGSLMPPKHILNAPTRLMKDLGYGRGYEYDHDAPEGFSGQNYFPDGIERRRLYHPSERGFEQEIAARLAYWDKLRARKGAGMSTGPHPPARGTTTR